jgi:hypothetical protein
MDNDKKNIFKKLNIGVQGNSYKLISIFYYNDKDQLIKISDNNIINILKQFESLKLDIEPKKYFFVVEDNNVKMNLTIFKTCNKFLEYNSVFYKIPWYKDLLNAFNSR